MRTQFFSLVLLCSSVVAADHLQEFTISAGSTVQFEIQDVDDIADQVYRIERVWFDGLQTRLDGATKSPSQGTFVLPPANPFQQQLYNEFIAHNATLSDPYILADVTATASAPSGGVVQFLEGENATKNARCRYTAGVNFSGTDEIQIGFRLTSNGNLVSTTTLRFNVLPPPPPPPTPAPSVGAAAAPGVTQPGVPVLIVTMCDQAAAIFYDYGDNTVGSANTHAYALPGVYTVKVTATNSNGSTSTFVTVTVLGSDHIPTARFTTSDLVAYEGLPFTFYGESSTDPQNALVGFQWNFGDESPRGSTTTISKVYAVSGTYTVTLTVTDAEGLAHSVAREIDVLPANQIGVFDAEVSYSTRLNRGLTNRDTLSFFARLNVGNTQVENGSPIAVQIGAKRFSGTLDRRGRAGVGNTKFTVKFGTRRQAPGEVEIRLTARQAGNLGDALAALGAGVTVDDIDVTVQIEIAGRTYVLPIPSTSEWTLLKGKVSGEL